jgi:hypothetical protein
MRTRCPGSAPVPRSAFADVRFPSDVIVVAVESREELVWLLAQACELEHGLMCEYLVEDDSLVLIRCSLDRAHRVETVGRRDAPPGGRAAEHSTRPWSPSRPLRRVGAAKGNLTATLARSSVACAVWAGVVSMTPPGRVAAAPALLAVVPLDRHSPARRYARTAPGPACYAGAGHVQFTSPGEAMCSGAARFRLFGRKHPPVRACASPPAWLTA